MNSLLIVKHKKSIKNYETKRQTLILEITLNFLNYFSLVKIKN
jgi:hypothetical protein